MTIVINGTTGISGVDGSAGTPAVQGTDTNTGVFYPAADTVGVSTGGSERVRVDSSGNVGIGTSSPSGRLHVDSSAGSLPLYVNSTASAQNVRVRLNSTDNASSVSYVMSYSHASLNKQASMLLGGTGAIGFYVGQTAGAEPTTGTLAQTIDSSGNVGIGQSSITQAFGGYTQLNISGSNGATIQMQSGATSRANLVADGNALYIAGLSGSIAFGVNGTGTGTEVGRFTSTGLFQFNSGYGSVATAYGCRAWVNYNVSSGTSAVIRGSGNITSVTYVGTGSSTVNFATAMPDVNYCVKGTASSIGLGNNNTYASVPENGTISTSAVSIIYVNDAGGSRNPIWVWVAIIR